MKTRAFSSVLASAVGVSCVVWLAFNGAVSAAEAPAPDLTGSVKGADGRVLTNASVFIYTAGPRVGVGYI